ncbi:MAG: hypothetical protein JST06_06385 [Bacteroidetes bacterium]|nr:hypothetical protein [Bacteroidota bacterium]MBS1629202.1 hypothetical protein [Bacteroidota bacterium]
MSATTLNPRRIGNPNSMYLVTCAVVDWVDVFTRRACRDAIIENLNFYHEQRALLTFGYVIMPSYCLFLFQQKEGNLAFTIRDFKKMTGRMIADLAESEPEQRRAWILHRFSWNAGIHPLGPKHQVWVHSSDAEEILTAEHFKERRNWLHHCPVRAGYVDHAEQWVYGSAYDLDSHLPKVKIYS